MATFWYNLFSTTKTISPPPENHRQWRYIFSRDKLRSSDCNNLNSTKWRFVLERGGVSSTQPPITLGDLLMREYLARYLADQVLREGNVQYWYTVNMLLIQRESFFKSLLEPKNISITNMDYFPPTSSSWSNLVGLVWFYGISTIIGYLMPSRFLHIY